ncbi:hypothetical protein EST38_g9598 [Candolleomyces aberdarensis]|uniref:Uncharacterized protein n=1 Tax=Candolleomyces aberdarensis TaxID=2316362 RepID=A0A4Q2D9K6_9AGAR|nr:hypothetical protein EST38_g9598 [Candolleomyces aberdarensis]
MKFFTFTRVTRSGAQYNPFPVVPVVAPPDFELADLLSQAVALDADAYCMDDFFDPADSEVHSGTAEDSNDCIPSAGTPNAAFSAKPTAHAGSTISRKRQADDSENLKSGETVSELTDGEAGEGGRSSKRKRRRSTYRKKKSDQAFAKNGQVPRRADILKHVHLESKVDVAIELSNLPATTCGYRAQNMKQSAAMYDLEDLKAQGYTVIHFEPGTSKPLVDGKTGRIFGVIVHGVDDPTYVDTCKSAFEFLEDCRTVEVFYKNECDHRRGQFPAVNYGVSYGQGSKKPYLLNCKHQELMTQMLSNDYIIRLATFASYLFSMWAPNVYQYYRQRLDTIYKNMPELPRNFTRSIWPCAAFNFGPQTEKDFKMEDPEGYEKMMKEKEGRWKMGIGLWSTLEEILAEKASQEETPAAKG